MFDEVNIGMRIIQIENDEEKKHITRNILEALPDWFGISEAREEYIHGNYSEPPLFKDEIRVT